MEAPITVALAELKTLTKKIQKKRDFVEEHLLRDEKFKDPLEKEGGSEKVLAEAMQSIRDMQERYLAIKVAIAEANRETLITVHGQKRTIAEWLVWSRDIAPKQRDFLSGLSSHIHIDRRGGWRAEKETKDVIVHLSETDLQRWIEDLEETIGALDGELSLKNAVTFVQMP